MSSTRFRAALARTSAALLVLAGLVWPLASGAQATHHLTADVSASGSQVVTMRSSFQLDASHLTARTAGRFVVVEVIELGGHHRFVYVVAPRFRVGYRTVFNTPEQNAPRVPNTTYVQGGATFPRGKYQVIVVTDGPIELSIPFSGGTRDVALSLRQPVPKDSVDVSYGSIDGVTGPSPGIYRHTVHVKASTLTFVAGYITNATYQLVGVPPTAAEVVDVCAQQSPAHTPCADKDTAVARVAVMWFDDYSEWSEQVYRPGELAPGSWDAEVDSLGTAALGPLYPEAVGPSNVFGIPFACIVAVNL